MARWDRRTRLTAALGLRDETKRGLASASRGFQGYLSGVSRQASIAGTAVSGAFSGNAAFAAAGMGASFLAFSGQAISQFAEVEKKWAEVTTLMPQLSKTATDKMLKEARRLSVEMGVEMGDVLEATYQAVSAGVAPERAIKFLETATKTAKAGVTDLTTAVDVLTSVINAYGLEIEQAEHLSDLLFTSIRLGKTRLEEIAPTLGRILPLANSLGVEFGQITAAIAALTVQGSPTAEAMTQIRASLVALSKDSSIANQIFREVAGQTFPDFIVGGGTLQEALQMIVREARKTGQSIPQAFGRVEGAMAAMALSSDEAAQTYRAAMTDVEGATEEAFGVIEDTSAQTIARLKARWSDLVTTVGSSIVGTLGMIDSMLSGSGVGRYGHIRTTQQWSAWPSPDAGMAAWMETQAGLGGTILGQPGGLQKAIEDARNERDRQIVATALGFSVSEPGRTRYSTVVRQPAPATHEFGFGGFSAPSGYALSAGALGLPYDWEGGIPPALTGGGGGGGRDLADAMRDNTMSLRDLADLMRSGQALTVQLDAQVDEGVILRADTVQRADRQLAARFGNMMTDRVRSG